jgi:hypothetical protein
MQGPLAQRQSAKELSSAISPTFIALPLLLPKAQMIVKCTALSFVGINTQVYGLVADGQIARNLPRAPLQLQWQLRLLNKTDTGLALRLFRARSADISQAGIELQHRDPIFMFNSQLMVNMCRSSSLAI